MLQRLRLLRGLGLLSNVSTRAGTRIPVTGDCSPKSVKWGKGLTLLVLLATFLGASSGFAATITTAGSGNWNSVTVNAPWPGGTVPATTDDVIIRAGDSVTVTANATINSVVFNNVSTSAATLTVNGTFVLTVTAGITLQNSATIATSATITGAGT